MPAACGTAKTNTVGCIFSDIRNPLYTGVIRGADELLSQHNYALMIANSAGSTAQEVALINLFTRRRVDALILSLADETNKEMIAAVKAARIPTVLIERELPLPIPSVGTDHAGGLRQATDYLIGLGHRRIALVTGGKNTRAGRERVRGYMDSFAAHNLPLDTALLRLESLSVDYSFSETQHLLDLDDPPTAIISGGNLMLAGVLRATQMRNIEIPRQLSVISSGDTELAELATPPITVLRWDLGAIGRRAAELVLRRLRDRTAEIQGRVELPIEFILRRSCAPPPRR